MELIKGTSSLTFTRDQQRDVFDKIKKLSPEGLAYKKAEDNLKVYIKQLLEDYLIPGSVQEKFKTCPEFFNATRDIRLSSEKLEFCSDRYFPSKDDKAKVCTEISIDLDTKVPYARRDSSSYDITADLTSCDIEPGKMETLKDLVLDYLDTKYRLKLFNIPEWCFGNPWDSYWSFYPFRDIKTWGRLYHINPEWYEVLVELYKDEIDNIKKNIIGGSISETINNMKTLVNYV